MINGPDHFPAPIMPEMERALRAVYDGDAPPVGMIRTVERVIRARFRGEAHLRGFRSFAAAMAFARDSREQHLLMDERDPDRRGARRCVCCGHAMFYKAGAEHEHRSGFVTRARISVARVCDRCMTIETGEFASVG